LDIYTSPSETKQIHDFNPAFGPEVSPVGSNGFGTRTFWTVAIPDSDVAVQFGAGKAEMRVDNLALPDFGTKATALGKNWQTAGDPAMVSFDVVWSGPITRRLSVLDGTQGNHYAGEYVENQVTVTWSGTNLKTGFNFTSNPGTLATSSFDGGFAELGHERNGSFFPSGGGSGGGGGSAFRGGNHAALVQVLMGQAALHSQVPSGASNLNGSTHATDAVFGSPALLNSFQGNSRGLNISQADYWFLQGQTRHATHLLEDVFGTDSLDSGL
jgi:hypothetical protein